MSINSYSIPVRENTMRRIKWHKFVEGKTYEELVNEMLDERGVPPVSEIQSAFDKLSSDNPPSESDDDD